MKELTIEQKVRAYDEAVKEASIACKDADKHLKVTLERIFPELKESEQNILFEELKALHLKMEYQTVCNDAGGNRMWRRAWQHVNEAINIIKEDKEAFKW
jgi:hypothetical protein